MVKEEGSVFIFHHEFQIGSAVRYPAVNFCEIDRKAFLGLIFSRSLFENDSTLTLKDHSVASKTVFSLKFLPLLI